MSAVQPPTESTASSPEGLPFMREVALRRLLTRHEELARLCDQLEACADRLPAWPTGPEADRLREALGDFVAREAGSRNVLVADVFGRVLRDPLAAALIRHVDVRHTDDLIHAQDLIAALGVEPAAKGRIAAETLAYMLRCFFTAGRQTMVLEELAILALDQHGLTADGRSRLIDGLCRRAA